MSKNLSGKVALITGASKGIGAAIAKHLAAAGAAVAVNYAASKAGADQVVSDILVAGGKAIAVQGDVSKPDDVTRMFAESNKALGSIEILINNAGVYEFAPLEQITLEHFHRQFEINVLGLLLATREAVKYIGPNGGSIVNISSVVSSLTPVHGSVYNASKAAVDAITKTLAKELAPRKIRVNAVNPGMVETEGVHTAGLHTGDMRQWVESTTPLGRIGQVEDIAPAVVFLASDQAGYITGENLFVSGGSR
jgi:3-oxoacyl-[acyl-carrier protein] reductase